MIKYFFKLPGGGDWWHCNKVLYDYCSETGCYETKVVA